MRWNKGGLSPKDRWLAPGLFFGFYLPLCSLPVLLALLTLSATQAHLALGFAALFVFGWGLSLLLLGRNPAGMARVRSWVVRLRAQPRLRYLPGLLLAGFGAYTLIYFLFFFQGTYGSFAAGYAPHAGPLLLGRGLIL